METGCTIGREGCFAGGAWRLAAGWMMALLVTPTAWGQATSGFAPKSRLLRPPTQAAPARQAEVEDEELAELTQEERINIAVYEQSHRSVVHIETRSIEVGGFFGAAAESQGSGSGSVWDDRGHILTNFHVVQGAQQLVVTLHDGQQFDATLVGADPPNDVAILRIDAPPETLAPVRPGRSDRLRVGQRVFALGSPLGLEQTMTVGIVSSLNRTLPGQGHRVMKSIIQIDAALNQGNSGGPLMDSRGRLIGMNTAIASRVGESSGIGFAIPVATILRVAPQLIEHGRVERPTIGIDAVAETDAGLLIVTIAPDGPADRAGLKGARIVRRRTVFGDIVLRRELSTGDIVTAIEGERVRTVDDLLSVVESRKAGDVVQVSVSRADGSKARIAVRLASDNGRAE